MSPAPSAGQAAIDALSELGRAIGRAAEALRAIPGDDEATAFVCARPLDTALAGLISLLDSVPVITGLGDPAPAVRESLTRSRAQLSAKRAEVAAYRAVLDESAQTRDELAAAAATASELRDQVAMLRRDKALAEEIPGLRSMTQALEADIAALDVSDASQVRQRLAAAIERLSACAEQQHAVMGEAALSLTARALTAARELDGLRARTDTAAADLARHESDAEQLMAAHGDTLAVLTAWSKADRDLADGLRDIILAAEGSALDGVRAELDGITARLKELDDRLGPLLAAHAAAYAQARQPRSP